jgi:malonyl-CoA/methylmalonyl-CoA synthetase
MRRVPAPSAPTVPTLPELFRAGRPVDGTSRFLEVPGGEVLTYDGLDELSGRYAHALVDLGVAPGDRVAVQVEKSPEAVALYVACLRTGAVFLPVNTAYGDEELSYLLGDAEPALTVLDPDRPPVGSPGAVLTLDTGGAGTLTEAASGHLGTFDDVVRDPADPAALLYTSGTTGRPKGALLSHANLAANAITLCDVWGFRGDDVLLHVLPIFHAHGLFVALHCVLASGASTRFLPRFDVDATLEALPASTVLMGVPTHYTRLLADPRLDAARCRNVRLFVSGSAPLSAATHEAFRERTGHAILERYGMTETVMITSNPRGGERPGTVGRPLPGVEVRLGEGTVDGVGPVEVRGPSVFAGYWRRPELASTEFTPDGWFRTGDLGSVDHDGYLHLVGRSKDLVITGGLNVYPKEVEAVLDALPGVEESAVVGLPHPDLGEAVVAVVVPRAGAVLDPEQLRTETRAYLAAFKVPKQVHLVDALPRNAMGKVEKAVLRDRLDVGTADATP